jgi:hypothetical protein
MPIRGSSAQRSREARLALEILEASAGLLYETKAPRVGRGFQRIAIMRDGALIDSETKAVSARFQQQSTRSVNQTLTCGFAQRPLVEHGSRGQAGRPSA